MGMHQTNINAMATAAKLMGVEHVVICPGSRNAPLVMSFWRIGAFNCHSVVDERSAAFIALGMAKQTLKPVILICTSGSALVNFYPAILEAFYSQIPLVILSADRPPEWIDQWDGQAIHQSQIFGQHVKGFLATPSEDNLNPKAFFECMEQGLKISLDDTQGPFHINVPLREPLYDAVLNPFDFPEFELNFAIPAKFSQIMWPEFTKDCRRILIVHGADHVHTNSFRDLQCPVISDVISNKWSQCNVMEWENILNLTDDIAQSTLQADLLITTGKMLVSKSLKQFLRKNQPKHHIHISENHYCADPFQTNPIHLHMSWEAAQNAWPFIDDNAYLNQWLELNEKSKAYSLFDHQYGLTEPNAFALILEQLSSHELSLHLANSMTVRWASYLLPNLPKQWQVYANRGVSGIDGCTSTAIGMAMTSNHLHLLFTGDLAFAYDNNAWFQSGLPNNFKAVVFNNFGGGIFDQIEGPGKMPEKHLIQTPHKYNFEQLSKHYHLQYFCVKSMADLQQLCSEFFQVKGPSILEIQTNQSDNQKQFSQFKSYKL